MDTIEYIKHYFAATIFFFHVRCGSVRIASLVIGLLISIGKNVLSIVLEPGLPLNI